MQEKRMNRLNWPPDSVFEMELGESIITADGYIEIAIEGDRSLGKAKKIGDRGNALSI